MYSFVELIGRTFQQTCDIVKCFVASHSLEHFSNAISERANEGY